MQEIPYVKACPNCRSIEDALLPYGAYPVQAVPSQEPIDHHLVVWVCRRCGHVELRQAA